MNSFRAHSDHSLYPSPADRSGESDDSNLEGVTATVKLLMKLIQDHKLACGNGQNDSRRMLRVAGMMTILENVKTRIQKSQSFGNRKREAYLGDQRPADHIDEKERLRKELSASLSARKSLEAMCSSLGKEKEIMAGELTRKVHELSEMEELVSDLKTRNETLLAKVKEKKRNGVETTHGNVALKERNKALSEQLLRSLEGYKSMKRKLKEAHEENRATMGSMEEMGVEVGASLDRIRGLKDRVEIEEIVELKSLFECFQIKVMKHGQKKGECVLPKCEIMCSKFFGSCIIIRYYRGKALLPSLAMFLVWLSFHFCVLEKKMFDTFLKNQVNKVNSKG